MTDAQRYFRGARDMIRRARKAAKVGDICEARRCRYLAMWFLEYRQKLLSNERSVVPANSNSQRKELST